MNQQARNGNAARREITQKTRSQTPQNHTTRSNEGDSSRSSHPSRAAQTRDTAAGKRGTKQFANIRQSPTEPAAGKDKVTSSCQSTDSQTKSLGTAQKPTKRRAVWQIAILLFTVFHKKNYHPRLLVIFFSNVRPTQMH